LASVNKDPKSGFYRIRFRYGGRQEHRSLETKNSKEAEAFKGKVETTLLDLKRGRLVLPADADFWSFVFSDGKRGHKAEPAEALTLQQLFDRYVQSLPPDSMEANSLATRLLHKKHLLRHLGARRPVRDVTTATLQGYINDRCREKFRGRTISPRTVKKEVGALRTVWLWARVHGLVAGDPPTRGLRYGKEEPLPPFQTWAQIEERIARGGLSPAEVKRLWDALFLDRTQIAECLAYVKSSAAYPFVYAMFVFVAHTGARRSEMRRSRVEDFDFAAGRVSIREKKRDRSKKETRRDVQMSPLLQEVMRDYLARGHPGGPHTFCLSGVVPRSRKRSRTTGHKGGKARPTTLKGRLEGVREREALPGPEPLTEKEAHDHFKRALAGGKWEVVRGFHVFRHSFASSLAAAGARQEVIDGLMGHQTEEMRRRYRHLFPHEMKDAIRRVFG
jgi:integrase